MLPILIITSNSLESIVQSPIKKGKHYFKVLQYPL